MENPFSEKFKFESTSQEKGMGNLAQYLKSNGVYIRPENMKDIEGVVALVASYFIQKNHEAQEWFVNLIGDLEHQNQDYHKAALDAIASLNKRINHLEDKVL